jgi:hypothetical protein
MSKEPRLGTRKDVPSLSLPEDMIFLKRTLVSIGSRILTPSSQKSKHSHVEAAGKFSWGTSAEGRGSFEVIMKEFYFYGLMRKEEGVCVLPDFGSAGGHTEGYSKRQVLGKRERRVMVSFSFFPTSPTSLTALTFAIK